nr:beta family protein [Brevibacillus laterosporus]
MFDEREYVPILKWKRSEQSALKELTHANKQRMTPLIEIQPVPFDHDRDSFKKTLDQHLDKIGEQVKNSWSLEKAILVDVFTMYDNEDFDSEELLQNGVHPVEFVLDSIQSHGTKAIPVTGIRRYQSFQDAIKKMSTKYNNGVCIRLESEELTDLSETKSDLDFLLEFLTLSPNEIDLVLDYKQINFKQKKAFIQEIILTLSQFPYLRKWRTVTISSTTLPRNLSLVVPSNTYKALPRSEWAVYKNLSGLNLARVPAFGDYNINNPEFLNLNPKFINPAVSIKYTTEDEYLINKGGSYRKNGLAGMSKLAQQIITHPHYSGNTFSYGDNYIYLCANGGPSGNLETWVTVGVNHHLTLVVNDLANLYGS